MVLLPITTFRTTFCGGNGSGLLQRTNNNAPAPKDASAL
jgi:hypothetical protein